MSWLIAAGQREDGSTDDFYAALEAGARAARARYHAQHAKPLPGQTYVDYLLPVDEDFKRHQLEAATRTVDRLIATIRDLTRGSLCALVLQEANYPAVHYVPLSDVDPEVLRPSRTSTYCPYKGDASYYSIATPESGEITDAIWTYEKPYDAVADIASHVAFYPDRVEIVVLERGNGTSA